MKILSTNSMHSFYNLEKLIPVFFYHLFL